MNFENDLAFIALRDNVIKAREKMEICRKNEQDWNRGSMFQKDLKRKKKSKQRMMAEKLLKLDRLEILRMRNNQ